ncbi:S4 domain-containing protein [Elsinoe australis]|uniref:S4 domain-containing protein n=1 Tax=Elsinoe australis TaxID=40998 RepID=A0A4U7B2R1_9PEZI|nr:S4 domain-containing protein [Elsinoe australis]
MAGKRFHNLKRPKARQDWSKWTLYNISRLREPRYEYKTFFQQKWESKSLTRAFHGNQIREKKWQLMFDRRLPAVVQMDAKRLATTDGRQQSAGRGAGREVDAEEESEDGDRKVDAQTGMARTPYMQMAYWPTERRLDTAVWRALFASSALQARQFVVHGAVKVNGKKMRHPGYMLNPGDMFQVEPEKVMYATGARKFDKNSPETKQGRSGDVEDGSARRSQQEIEDDEDAEIEETIEDEEAEKGVEAQSTNAEAAAEDTEAQQSEDPKKALRNLLLEAKEILADPKEKAKLSGKQKQAMRAFSRQVRSTMSRIRGDEAAEDTVEALQETLEKLLGGDASAVTAEAEAEADPPEAKSTESEPKKSEEKKETLAEDENKIYPHRDARLLRQALDIAQRGEGAVDAKKPYATPWQPREYMSAFAFIPRYLEVNQKICSAVYLRHPVARPGLAEVPSPFPEETHELAHNWYLRRR